MVMGVQVRALFRGEVLIRVRAKSQACQLGPLEIRLGKGVPGGY